MKKVFSFIAALLFTATAFAQEQSPEFMLRGLKLYVVIGVLCIILTIIFSFLFAIERRLKKLEEGKGQ